MQLVVKYKKDLNEWRIVFFFPRTSTSRSSSSSKFLTASAVIMVKSWTVSSLGSAGASSWNFVVSIEVWPDRWQINSLLFGSRFSQLSPEVDTNDPDGAADFESWDGVIQLSRTSDRTFSGTNENISVSVETLLWETRPSSKLLRKELEAAAFIDVCSHSAVCFRHSIKRGFVPNNFAARVIS